MLGEFLDQRPGFVLRHSREPMRVQRIDEEDRPAGDGVLDHRRPCFLGIFAVEILLRVAFIEPHAVRAVVAAMQPGHPGEPLLHRLRQRVIGGAHIGEHRPALGRRHFLGVQDRQARRHLLVRAVGMPIGRPLDAEPVDLAVFVDVGEPRHLGVLNMAIIDQRMDFGLAEEPAERGELGRAEVLLAEHQHRMLGESVFDPGQRLGVRRLRQVEPERFGAERMPKRTNLARAGHGVSSVVP